MLWLLLVVVVLVVVLQVLSRMYTSTLQQQDATGRFHAGQHWRRRRLQLLVRQTTHNSTAEQC